MRIYCFINSGKGTDWVSTMAMAEDGTCVGQHASSNDWFARADIGYADCGGPGAEKRKHYAECYPGGYELEWLDSPQGHRGLMAAYELNQEKRRQHEEGRDNASTSQEMGNS